MLELAVVVETLDRGITGADFDFDNVAQSSQVDERGDDGAEFWVSFQGVVSLASGFADCVTEEDA